MHCPRCGHLTRERVVDGMPRPVCPSCGRVVFLDPKLAVTAVILRHHDGRTDVLLGRRAAHTRNPGGWSFPAGFVNRGEQVEDALCREVLEETGLSVTPGPLLGVWSVAGDATVLLAWRAASWSGDAAANDDLTRIEWHDAEDLPPLAFAHDRDILAQALEIGDAATEPAPG